MLPVAVCGAGQFCRKTLLPALEATGRIQWSSIASATGISAAYIANRRGFHRAVSRAEDAASDAGARAVVIATRHDTPANIAAIAMNAGKTVFVEKPLAVCEEQLIDLESTPGAERVVTGYNRRFALATRAVMDTLSHRRGRLQSTSGSTPAACRQAIGRTPPIRVAA